MPILKVDQIANSAGTGAPTFPFGLINGGTISGGTFSGITLSGTTTATGSTISGGTFSGIIASGGTFSGITLSGITSFPGSGQISAAGDVGIGGTPTVIANTRVFHLQFAQNVVQLLETTSAGERVEIRFKNTVNTHTIGMELSTGSVFAASSNALVLQTGGPQNIEFFTNNSSPSAANMRMQISASGLVGIGTASTADGILTVKRTGDNRVLAIYSDQNNARITFLDSTTTSSPQLYSSGNNLVFGTNAVEVARFTSGGQLGIGTNNPSGNCYIHISEPGQTKLRITTRNPSADVAILEFENTAVGVVHQMGLENSTGGGGGFFGATANAFAFRTQGAFNIEFFTTNVKALTITAGGAILPNNIHNNDGAGNAANQAISSGTYTPTLTTVSNVASSAAHLNQWMRVGNVVTVSGQIEIDPSTPGTVQLRMSLPVPSTFGVSANLGGTAVLYDFSNVMGIYGSGTSAQFDGVLNDNGNRVIVFSFTYLVL